MKFTIVIPIKPWPNGLTSQSKFAKPELVYGLAKGGQTDSQVGLQVAKSHKFHAYLWLMCFYNNRLLAINLCRFALGGQTVKNLHLLASKFELNQSQRKSTQVVASRHKWVAKRNTSWTSVDLRVCLARALWLKGKLLLSTMPNNQYSTKTFSLAADILLG